MDHDRGHRAGSLLGPGVRRPPRPRTAASARRSATGNRTSKVPCTPSSKAAWQVVLLTGVASLVLGVLVLVWPGASLFAAGILFGIYLLISGVFQLVSAARHPQWRPRCACWRFISGALSIVLGLFSLPRPDAVDPACSPCGSASAG
ncbi:HdeD family acid-resistance protein [Streptomyces sp. L7]